LGCGWPIGDRIGGTNFVAHDDNVASVVRSRLEQDRIHPAFDINVGGGGLHGLGSSDLSPIRGDGGVVRHVLRFEGRDKRTPSCERTTQASGQRRLADTARGADDKDAALHSIVAW